MDAYGYDRELEERDQLIGSLERELDRLDAQYHEVLAQNRELEAEVASLQAQLSAARMF